MSARPYRGADRLPGWWTGLRGVPLVALAVPFLPALMLALAGGQSRLIGGCVAGIAGVAVAFRYLQKSRRKAARKAAIALGVGTGLAAGLAGGAGPLGGVVLGLMAWGGARLLYDGIWEQAPPPPPPPPRPRDGLETYRDRLAALRGGDRRLLPAVTALDGLLGELAARPGVAESQRRLMVVGLDGLERIGLRLAQGAEPPATLVPLVEDLARSAREASHELRATETEALEIQVKVLQDRLRQEGSA
ncbi:hypothetical protein [Muricoccus radiodurans]|uniref:hypothetical protein n=1 Tax=Muricoccus radiodurans TaxID=2231721 RepID=UPI003CEBFE95